MIESIIGALIGPIGGILAGLGALIAALALGRYTGGRDARAKRDVQDGKDYIAERRRQDELDVGHGATDDERIKHLQSIAKRNSKRKN